MTPSSKKNTLIEGKYTEEQLCATAKTIVARKTNNSKVLDRKAEDAIPRYDDNEIVLGRVLGRGGFCVVNEITKITLLRKEESLPSKHTFNKEDDDGNDGEFENEISNIIQDRSFMAQHYLRGKTKDCRYAIKKLQDSCYSDASTFINGVVDLAVEARFLSVIRHANIIKMRAMATCNPYDTSFFVILDRLYDVLTVRLQKWKKQKPAGMRKLLDRGGKKELEFWLERVYFAYDLACALKYLHELNIMYRDIKPDNIGFDVRGDIKIFDFGLAKEFDPTERDANGFFRMTGDTGSPRYMDPQVAMNKPYNELCDVYSFAILLWEMLELEVPFEGYSMNMFTKRVVQGGARPMVNVKWPPEIQRLLRSGFGDITQRLDMVEVCEILRQEISRESGQEIVEFKDISHRGDNKTRNQLMLKSKSAMSVANGFKN